STINPDVLYIKSPGATLQSNLSSGIDLVCTKTNDPCVCWDGNPPAILPATPDDCAKECRASDQCNDFSVDTSCVAAEGTNKGYIDPDTGTRMCRCYDQEDIPIGAAVNCNDACVDNCGWKFLVAKLDAHGHGNWESGEDLFHLDLDAEIWEMFLTNDGKYKGFNITAPSYTVGVDTYHCAVLTIDEDSFPLNAAIDEYRIYWVKEGTSIGKVEENGGSFREDVESSGVANSWVECCSSVGGPACDINTIFPPAECDGNQRIWYSRYKDDITSYCGTCSSPVPPAFSISDTAFSPNGKITCTVINGNGFWRKNY
ncbi:MAG: hypothetical protein KAS78_00660, partial [Candidatus Pacebacteria bacterium]|nr:hypothetical protein [Candidatus Paceibacterota bacterium]